jgi:hypothetical protein
MRPPLATFIGGLVLLTALTSPALAQTAPPTAAASPAANPHPARELTVSKCFQCHSDTIWRDQRQDARAWEAALYRMVARGSVWTGDDIKTMATFLAADYGPNSPRSAPASRP